MAALGITSRESILRAIAECDELGREEFLRRSGFGRARTYVLLHNGREYDSKAIVGVARKFEKGSPGPWRPEDFSGGEKRVVPILEHFGFKLDPASGQARDKADSSARGKRYWALCANPNTYRIQDAVRERTTDLWTTKGKDIRLGDRLVIWKTAGKDGQRGVVALAEVVTNPQPQGDADNPYWIHPDDSLAPRVEVRYVRAPLLPIWIGDSQSGVLEGLAVARARGGTVFSVSPSQWDAIVRAAGGWANEDDQPELALPPIGDVEIPSSETPVIRPGTGNANQGAGSTGGSGRSQNSKVVGDRAEAIALEYIKRHVRGVSRLRWVANLGEKPGWDIEYLNGDGDLVAVEVKGTTASEFSSFELTDNELQACRRLGERYWLYLVAGCGGPTPSIQCIQLAPWLDQDRVALTPVRWQAQLR